MNGCLKQGFGWVAVFALGVGVGHVLNQPLPKLGRGGKIETSPNEEMWAMALTQREGPLLGKAQVYSEYIIQTAPPNARVLRRVRIEDSAQTTLDNAIQWRDEGDIKWKKDGSAATFSYDGPQMNFQMILKRE